MESLLWHCGGNQQRGGCVEQLGGVHMLPGWQALGYCVILHSYWLEHHDPDIAALIGVLEKSFGKVSLIPKTYFPLLACSDIYWMTLQLLNRFSSLGSSVFKVILTCFVSRKTGNPFFPDLHADNLFKPFICFYIRWNRNQLYFHKISLFHPSISPKVQDFLSNCFFLSENNWETHECSISCR